MVRSFDYELRDGRCMPALGLGTWALRGERCRSIVKRAIELGYTHIDTADSYDNHKEVGDAIKGFDRSTLFLVSKVRQSRLQYHAVIQDCHRNLRELDTEYLDLYLIHWPNERIPIRDTLRALNELVGDGNNQIRLHPYEYDHDLVAFCHAHKIVVTAYSPLGRGGILSRPTILDLAKQYGRTPAQICLRWGLQKGVVVIPKTSSEARLKENMDIFDWEISQADMTRLDTLT
jgi:2,5-diketo-D-gluconate reductase B